MKISNTPYYASSIFLATALAVSPVVADQNPSVQEADRAGTDHASEPERGLQETRPMAADKSKRAGGVEADDIVGKDVVNQSEEKIGNIEEIVRHQQSQDLHAVVSVGGFLGMGEKEVIIPLKELQVMDDGIRAPQTANTKEQLKALPIYDQSMYQEVADDHRIDRADFAAFESDDD